MKFLVLLLLSAPAWAQIERPILGMMLDQNGALQPVVGVAASATLGDPVLTGVLSSACSARLCLAKTASAVVAFPGGSTDAPPGPAIFALDGDQAYIYFPESRSLARWHDGILDRLDFTSDGEVIAMRSRLRGFDYVLRGSTPAGPVMLLGGATLRATDDTLRMVRDDGSETDLEVPGITGFLTLGEGYVEIFAASGIFGLRVDSSTFQLFLLPGTQP